jgi:hypothetical protein
MPRYLVVANQTLGGEQLMGEVRARMATPGTSFHVLVPQTRPPRQPAISSFAGEPSHWDVTPPDADAEHRSILTSQARLDQLISRIRAEGGEVQGELGDEDPLSAIDSLVGGGGSFDGIIISTLPTGVSRWLRMDLPHKVERKYKLPVTTVTAKPGR